MSVPARLQLYMGNGKYPTTNHMQLSASVVATVNATTAFGWNVGTNSIPRVVQLQTAAEVSRTSPNPPWNATITGSGPNARIGDSLVYGPLNGDFDETNWEVSWSFKAVSAASTHLGRLLFRVYKAPSVNLSGSAYPPYLLSASFFSGSSPLTNSFAVTNISPSFAATTTINQLTGSFTLGPQQFRNEFLMFQTFFNLTTVGGSVNGDADYLIGPTSGTIKTANFTQYRMNTMKWNDDDFG